MLKYCESFDHVTVSALPSLGWTVTRAQDWVLVPGAGRWGTTRLDWPDTDWNAMASKYITLSRSCTRMVIGLAWTRYYVSGSRNVTNGAFTVGFCYGTFINFRVTVTPSASGLTFSFTTGNGTGYPAIPDSAYVSVPFLTPSGPTNITQPKPYTFIEILVDVTNYKNGTVKCGVNGDVVCEATGIVTCAYNGFGDNPYDPKAKINAIEFGRDAWSNHYSMSLDSIYICDDDGGYNNDFLGDIFVKTIYPAADGGKIDWSPYINGLAAPDDTPRVTLIDDPVFDPVVELNYIQADQDLVQETMSIGGDNIPVDSTLIAVNHRTAARSVASPGTPPQNTLIPLYKSQGNDIIVTNSLAKKFTGWTYQFLDVYYNLVPGLTVDWTKLLLDESQFGFMLRESIWTGVMLEEIGFADEVIDA